MIRVVKWKELFTRTEVEEIVVDILTELKSEIEEKATELCDDGWWLTYNDIIQQKINALKCLD